MFDLIGYNATVTYTFLAILVISAIAYGKRGIFSGIATFSILSILALDFFGKIDVLTILGL